MRKRNARAGKESVTPQEILKVFKDTLAFIEHQHGRFIVPEEFLPDHPERDLMIQYFKGLSWRGTESGAAQIAGVSLRKVRDWREYEEFVEFEELANEACTDLIEETLLYSAYATGDTRKIETALKARRASYNDKLEVTGPKGAPIAFNVIMDSVPRPKRLEEE